MMAASPRPVSTTTVALRALDTRRAADALDGAFEKFASYDETGVMVDELAERFPALAAVVARLAERSAEEPLDEPPRRNVVAGCTIGLIALVEYGHAEGMRQAFGDVPDR